jgi:hypothetical protein
MQSVLEVLKKIKEAMVVEALRPVICGYRCSY